MKKNLTSLTGIVLLISLLIAFGCRSKEEEKGREIDLEVVEDPDVTIVLNNAVERKDKRKHLEMYNSYNPDSVVVDSLITDVSPGDIIIWDKKSTSGIRIIHVRPIKENGIIFPEAAKEMSYKNKKVFTITIPDGVKPGTIEKYEIVFEDDDKNTWCIDPHLRIPPPAPKVTDDPGDR